MPALEPSRLSEIRALVAELGARPTTAAADVDGRLLVRCGKALADVLGDRDDLAADFAVIAEELATWTGALR
ncbi:hypothetical protein ACFWVB_02655 [Streptomyces microflavus]|uniref:hypothetical protein n=1 Tax=Streptomyces microflavus TaxID=1919 RepID=UPI00366856BE